MKKELCTLASRAKSAFKRTRMDRKDWLSRMAGESRAHEALEQAKKFSAPMYVSKPPTPPALRVVSSYSDHADADAAPDHAELELQERRRKANDAANAVTELIAVAGTVSTRSLISYCRAVRRDLPASDVIREAGQWLDELAKQMELTAKADAAESAVHSDTSRSARSARDRQSTNSVPIFR